MSCGTGLGLECNFVNSNSGKIKILDSELSLKGKKKIGISGSSVCKND